MSSWGSANYESQVPKTTGTCIYTCPFKFLLPWLNRIPDFSIPVHTLQCVYVSCIIITVHQVLIVYCVPSCAYLFCSWKYNIQAKPKLMAQHSGVFSRVRTGLFLGGGRFYWDNGKIKSGQIWPLSTLGLLTRENFTKSVVEVTQLAV